MHKKHQKVFRILSLVLVVCVFVLAVLAYFFAFHFRLGLKCCSFKSKQVNHYEQMIKPDWSFEKDLNRFLTVYFNQKFEKTEHKLKFLYFEKARFENYSLFDENEKSQNVILVNCLKNMLGKAERGELDFSTEEAKLKQLLKGGQ
jgi:hypothetical protein